MPFDKSKYPKNWTEFSRYIRRERAKNVCEQCKAPNGETVNRGVLDGEAFWHDQSSGVIYSAKDGLILGRARNYELTIDRETVIVLTVAHLDNDGGVCDCRAKTGMKCAIKEHVKALCQKCHLALDMPHHIANRRKTLGARKDAGRRLFSEIV